MEEKKCMKCGREAEEGMAFCAECLAEAEKYPVKPGVVVLLPQREVQPPKPVKPAGRRKLPGISPEEQVKRLKKDVISLSIVLVLTIASVAGLLWYVVEDYLADQEPDVIPGQNYSAEISSDPEDTD